MTFTDIKIVFEQIKRTLKSFSIIKSQHEALVSFDFEKTGQREALMRICFSPLAAWPVLIALLVFWINPYRYQISMTSTFGMENFLVQALFGTDWLYAGILAALFFAISFFTRQELLLVSLVGYLLSQGDLHLFLALILLGCIVLARIFTNFRWVRFLESYTRTIWMMACCLSLMAWAIAMHVSLEAYKTLFHAGYFSQSMHANRLEAFILAAGLYYGLELFILAAWGHFFMRKQREPSEFLVKYSSARVLRKLSLSRAFKTALKEKIETISKTKPHYQKTDLDLLPKRLVDLHRKEDSFLTTAITDLT
jgi:hypothetical protein